MDSLITAAGPRAAIGDAIGALKLVGLRNDPPALALRGIAMAQLGDLARAKELLKRAARAFGPKEARRESAVHRGWKRRSRSSTRDLAWNAKALEAARVHPRGAWRSRERGACAIISCCAGSLLIGRIAEAETLLAELAARAAAARVAHRV